MYLNMSAHCWQNLAQIETMKYNYRRWESNSGYSLDKFGCAGTNNYNLASEVFTEYFVTIPSSIREHIPCIDLSAMYMAG